MAKIIAKLIKWIFKIDVVVERVGDNIDKGTENTRIHS